MPSNLPLRDIQSRPEPPDLQRLYDEHAPFVRALARQLLGSAGDPDDVTQDVFVLAWRKYDASLGAPRPWLSQVTLKVAAAARRRAWVRRTLRLSEAHDVPSGHDPELSAETNEAFRALDAALRPMSEKKRAVFVLFELHGFSGQEIAEILGCPQQTVYTRLFHARREFFDRLGPEQLSRWSARR